ncbi:MAG: DUF1800 family protein, partial [Acidobacteria bacterium]|nr:DUF1800 family protein [Acidobacteriota bacterium]
MPLSLPVRRSLASFLALLLIAPTVPVAGATGLDEGGNRTKTLSEEQKILHLLNRLGFGPRPDDAERVQKMGIGAYIEQQLNPTSLPDTEVEARLESFETLRMSPTELVVAYPPPQLLRQLSRQLAIRAGMDPESGARDSGAREIAEELGLRPANRRQPAGGDTNREEASPERRRERMGEEARRGPQRILVELSQAKLIRALSSERQLQEVMTDFWFNHFNVFFGKGADRHLTTSYEYDAIRPHALGKFRDLLGATAHHPAMLFYLDNWMSVDPKADVDPRALRRRYLESAFADGINPGQLYAQILRNQGLDPARYLGPEGEPRGRRGRNEMFGDEMSLEQRLRLLQAVRGNRRGPRAGQMQRRPQQQQQQRRLGLNENYARELLELHTLGVDGGYTQQDIIEVARC